MAHAAVPFPVVPGKSESDVRRIADRFKADPAAYRESAAHGAVTLERATGSTLRWVTLSSPTSNQESRQ